MNLKEPTYNTSMHVQAIVQMVVLCVVVINCLHKQLA